MAILPRKGVTKMQNSLCKIADGGIKYICEFGGLCYINLLALCFGRNESKSPPKNVNESKIKSHSNHNGKR